MDTNTEKLFSQAFDMASGIIYYPIRHHSPGCAYHLEKIIQMYAPDLILIEGPSDMDHLIPYMINDGTVPPVCIYCSYDDKKGLVDESCEKYRAYYPFLEYSPEFAALKNSVMTGAEVHFIDMPFREILINDKRKELQIDFSEDVYKSEATYTKKISEENGCRDFSEFWERKFETSAPYTDSCDFVKNVISLGYYMRLCGIENETDHIKNVRREKYMADNILKYRKNHKKTLVVAGAYHIQGLLEPQNIEFSSVKSDPSASSGYLMPYSFFESDSRSGYGSGIMFPSFYQKIWERLHDQKKTDSAFEDTVLEYIVKTARYTRSKQPVSVPDEINAFSMAKSLAQLREKHTAGVFELTDSVRSTFVKGDINMTSSVELDFLYRQLTGLGIGKVTVDKGMTAPVVEDFKEQCRKFRIKTNTIAYQDITLETVKKTVHYEKSCFLHRMEFLNAGFCSMTSGADHANSQNTNLIREHWRCRYSTSVDVSLTDLSVFGESISRICSTLIEKKIRENMSSSDLGRLMLHIHSMGMDEIAEEKYDSLKLIILSDSDFSGVCEFTGSVKKLAVMHKIRYGDYPHILKELMSAAFERALYLMDSIKSPDDDKTDKVCKDIYHLYSLSMEYGDICSSEELCRIINETASDSECKNQVYGVMTAILFKSGKYSQEEFAQVVSSYLGTADENDIALFLCGIFMASRDILFTDEKLLFMIDDIVSSMDDQKFSMVLPNLRYAFTNFIPVETERVGRMIASRYDISDDLLAGSGVYSFEEVTRARIYDKNAAANLKKWGLV